MKYKIYLTDRLDRLQNEEFLGEADTFKDACAIISAATPNFDHYWRFIMEKKATFIDYGSWSRFAAIMPPVSKKEFAPKY